ncbi:unnamed protein product [Schistocephalus solidus]|uniref:Integrase catalytic domain-containing protein n=1 Tax=Schistocephalus solidus TaxID=70667 RepID=A0A3P7CUH5_SCHSO|nr:unnamed protein product [Schistocephalus solidus]
MVNALPRSSIDELQLAFGMATEQHPVGSSSNEDVSALQLQELPLTTGNGTIVCDVSAETHRPPPGSVHCLSLFSHLCVSIHPVNGINPSAWCRGFPDGQAFHSRWVASFGVPSTITTDSGTQLRSNVRCLTVLDSTRIHTAAYKPRANGMVERFRHQLKTPLRATEDWKNLTDNLYLGPAGNSLHP